MPPKPSAKKKTSPDGEPPSQEFYAALSDYYAAKDKYDALKVQLWDGIPEDPPSKCPKQPLEKPWWIREQEEQMAKMFPELDFTGDHGGVEGLKYAFEKLNTQEKASEEKEKGKEEGTKKGEKGKESEIWIDEDKLVAAWTGQEGLVVPPGLTFPK